jgi:hypothetical protein
MIATFGSRNNNKISFVILPRNQERIIFKKDHKRLFMEGEYDIRKNWFKKSPVGFLVPSLIFNRQDPFHATALLKTMYAVQVVKF